MYKEYNPNPKHKRRGDCVIRALTLALNKSWCDVFWLLAVYAFAEADTMESNAVSAKILSEYGFEQRIPRELITVKEFADAHPNGIYVLFADRHVLTLIDGIYFDSWQSGNENIIYYYTKEENL